MRGKSYQYDKCYNILGPWKDIPFRNKMKKYLSNDETKNLYAVEFYSSIENILRFVSILKEFNNGSKIFFEPSRSIGFRFSYKINSEKEHTGYIWVEILCESLDFIHQFIDIAKNSCNGDIHFHQGKYIP
jgi:hypothetical protein